MSALDTNMDPDPEVERDRTASSPAILADAVREVGAAFRSGNEAAIRAQLARLAEEAQLLSRTYPLPVGGLARRQRLYADR